MDVSVIAIGDELLIGQVTDTNSGDIARALTPFGWSLRSTRTVHDNAADIRDAITQAFAESDVVLTTGEQDYSVTLRGILRLCSDASSRDITFKSF